jgi:hypothetical protein
MKAAEADFARGNLDKARDGYLHVLMLGPTITPPQSLWLHILLELPEDGTELLFSDRRAHSE